MLCNAASIFFCLAASCDLTKSPIASECCFLFIAHFSTGKISLSLQTILARVLCTLNGKGAPNNPLTMQNDLLKFVQLSGRTFSTYWWCIVCFFIFIRNNRSEKNSIPNFCFHFRSFLSTVLPRFVGRITSYCFYSRRTPPKSGALVRGHLGFFFENLFRRLCKEKIYPREI